MNPQYMIAPETASVISDLQIKMLQCTDRKEIYRIIPEKIREILGFGIVFTSILYEETQSFKIEAYSGLKMSLDKFIKTVGFDPLKLVTPLEAVTPDELALFRSGHLELLEGGVYALGARRIPKTICKIIEKTLGVKYVYTMGFVSRNIHYGGLIIFSDRELSQYKPILEPIINQAAILVQRLWTEDKLKKAKLKAEENDKLKTAFLQNMSHEIRTPMNAICGFAELINDPESELDTIRYYTDIIQRSSLQLLNIINDVISLSLIETQQVTLNLSITNLDKLMNDLLEIYKPKEKEKNIKIILDNAGTDSKTLIKTDEVKLSQIMTNLLNNAAKFTTEGYINFGYVKRENSLEFYVEDTGIGISDEAQSHIFQRFEQEDKTIRSKYGGTGLGLTISKSYVELLGGQIWLESQKNKGTKFMFSIKHIPV